jgi:hypothetical protein
MPTAGGDRVDIEFHADWADEVVVFFDWLFSGKILAKF